MTTIGPTFHVKGELRTTEDITIEGRVEGHILAQDCALVFAATAEVTGEVLAQDITVFGRASGQLIATDVVDVRAGAHVNAQVVSRRFFLEEGSNFKGRVEPQHLEAALSVAKYQQRKRDAV